jgi:hypothetical protein
VYARMSSLKSSPREAEGSQRSGQKSSGRGEK